MCDFGYYPAFATTVGASGGDERITGSRAARNSRWLSAGPQADCILIYDIARGGEELYEASCFENLEEQKRRTLVMTAGRHFISEAAVFQNSETIVSRAFNVCLEGVPLETWDQMIGHHQQGHLVASLDVP